MDEKLARLDEILFNLFFSNELESEKGKKALNRKAKAMEIDEASLRKFIDKRLDKYLQAEDFLKDECTKNPLPENIKDEYFELTLKEEQLSPVCRNTGLMGNGIRFSRKLTNRLLQNIRKLSRTLELLSSRNVSSTIHFRENILYAMLMISEYQKQFYHQSIQL